MPDKKKLFDAINWQLLLDKADDLFEGGATRDEVDVVVKASIVEAAKAIDLAVDFDAILNGPWEALGDVLEASDYWMIRGALFAVWDLAKSIPRRKEKLVVLKARVIRLKNDDRVPPLTLVKRIKRLEEGLRKKAD